MPRPQKDQKTLSTMHSARVVEHIHDAVQEVEKSWDHRLKRYEALQSLKEKLLECITHDDLIIQRLGSIHSKLDKPSMGYHEFISLFVFLERGFLRSPVDHEIIITTDDRPLTKRVEYPYYIICDNIRSAHNIGSIFRIAECLGIKKIFLCGYTANPKNSKVTKTAMGCENFVEWESIEHMKDLIASLKAQSIKIIGLETIEKSKSLYDLSFHPDRPVALIFGNERYGIDACTLEMCDEICHLPLSGMKNSLNVSSAVSIAAGEIYRQFRLNH